MSPWKKFRYRVETALCGFCAWGVPRLSRSKCVRLGNALGQLGYLLDARGRAVGLANLECAFGNTMSPERRVAVLKESYRNFARTMVDLFWSPALMKPENRRFIRLHGWKAVNEQVGKRGAIYLSVHAGNWEWVNIASGINEAGGLAVAENFKNPGLTAIFYSVRQVSGQIIIPQENSMLRMLRAVKRGIRVGLLADLTVPPAQAATIVKMFGMEVSGSLLHGVLGQRSDALYVALESRPHPDGTCDIYAKVLDIPSEASLREVAQLCWDHYEPGLKRNPGLWLWAYKHFRYRPKGAERPYPFYANESKSYEKLKKKELGG